MTPAGIVTVCPADGAAGDQIKAEDQLPDTLDVACPCTVKVLYVTARIDRTKYLINFNKCVFLISKTKLSLYVGWCKYTVHSETLAGQGFQIFHELFNIAI